MGWNGGTFLESCIRFLVTILICIDAVSQDEIHLHRPMRTRPVWRARPHRLLQQRVPHQRSLLPNVPPRPVPPHPFRHRVARSLSSKRVLPSRRVPHRLQDGLFRRKLDMFELTRDRARPQVRYSVPVLVLEHRLRFRSVRGFRPSCNASPAAPVSVVVAVVVVRPAFPSPRLLLLHPRAPPATPAPGAPPRPRGSSSMSDSPLSISSPWGLCRSVSPINSFPGSVNAPHQIGILPTGPLMSARYIRSFSAYGILRHVSNCPRIASSKPSRTWCWYR